MWVVRAGPCHCVLVLAVVRVNKGEVEQECDSILRKFGRKRSDCGSVLNMWGPH